MSATTDALNNRPRTPMTGATLHIDAATPVTATPAALGAVAAAYGLGVIFGAISK